MVLVYFNQTLFETLTNHVTFMYQYDMPHIICDRLPECRTYTNRYKHVQMFENRSPRSILVYNFKTHLELYENASDTVATRWLSARYTLYEFVEQRWSIAEKFMQKSNGDTSGHTQNLVRIWQLAIASKLNSSGQFRSKKSTWHLTCNEQLRTSSTWNRPGHSIDVEAN